LAAIKNVGSAAMALAIEERTKNEEYASPDDFAKRLESRTINKKILESLTRAGAFDFSGEERAHLFARIDLIIAAASTAQKDRIAGQTSLFAEDMDFGSAPVNLSSNHTIEYEPWTEEEILSSERELLGFYVTGHPLDSYRPLFNKQKYKRLSELQDLKERRKYDFMGRIAGVDRRYTKKAGKPFAILTFEGFTGQSEVMVWPEVFERSNELLEVGSVIELQAKVEIDSRSDAKRLTAERVRILDKPDVALMENQSGKSSDSVNTNFTNARNEDFQNGTLTLYLRTGQHSSEDLQQIRSILCQHPGEGLVQLHIEMDNGNAVKLDMGSRFSVLNTLELREKLVNWMEN
jgi:DNA polymerase-3 subunit alpha